jgi:hypothetical protein
MDKQQKDYHEWFAGAVWRRVKRGNRNVFDIRKSDVFPLEEVSSLEDEYGGQVYEVVTVSRSIFHSRKASSDYGYGAKTIYHMDLQILKGFLNADHDEVVISIRSVSDKDKDQSNQD